MLFMGPFDFQLIDIFKVMGEKIINNSRHRILKTSLTSMGSEGFQVLSNVLAKLQVIARSQERYNQQSSVWGLNFFSTILMSILHRFSFLFVFSSIPDGDLQLGARLHTALGRKRPSSQPRAPWLHFFSFLGISCLPTLIVCFLVAQKPIILTLL